MEVEQQAVRERPEGGELPLEEPAAVRPRVDAISVNEIVLDSAYQELNNVDEDAEEEAAAATPWGEEPGVGEDEDFTYEKHLELVSLNWHDIFVAMPREEAKQQGCKMLKSGWVLTKNGDKKKARFVAKDIAYFRSTSDSRFFAATPSLVTFRLMLWFASFCGWGAVLTDISSAFLNAWLPEDALYAVEPAPESGLGKESVWKLRRALYGLRGAPRYWQEQLVRFVVALGFTRLLADSAVFVLPGVLIVLVHVDDLLVVGLKASREWLIEKLKKEFSLKHIHWLDHPGDEAVFVGKQVVKTKMGFTVAVPPAYVEKMAKVAGLEGAKASWVPGTKETYRPLTPDAN